MIYLLEKIWIWVMDISHSIVAAVKPLLEVLSYAVIVFVGWLHTRISNNEKEHEKTRQDLSKFKVHVAQNHPTNNQMLELENRLVREMNSGFESIKELLNASKKN